MNEPRKVYMMDPDGKIETLYEYMSGDFVEKEEVFEVGAGKARAFITEALDILHEYWYPGRPPKLSDQVAFWCGESDR